MISAPTVTSLLAWSIQVVVAVAAIALVNRWIRSATIRLYMWQIVVALALTLAIIEPVIQAGAEALGGPGAGFRPLQATAPTWFDQRHLWRFLAAGTALRLIWLAAGLHHLRRLRRRSGLLPNLPASRPGVRWFASRQITAPVISGWRHPRILIPSGVLHLPRTQQEAVVRHLMVHVARGDWLMVLLEEVVRGLLWFHPAIWFAVGRIQRERERLVDQAVVDEMGNPGGMSTFLPGSLRQEWYRASPGQTCF